MQDQLGDRMKHNYEEAFKTHLPLRLPTIIRLDGRAFHTFTKKIGARKPFDDVFIAAMSSIAQELYREVATTQMAYVQSDEISLLLHPYKKLVSQPWFGNEIQKIVSVSASIASSVMTKLYNELCSFDARAFVLPESEVCNYFIWRQKDAMRNAVLGIAQRFFSHRDLQGKSVLDIQDMMEKQYPADWKALTAQDQMHKIRGLCVWKGQVDWNIPVFTQDRSYIEYLLKVDDD
jgi:tRNA(His) guanylyltransferase